MYLGAQVLLVEVFAKFSQYTLILFEFGAQKSFTYSINIAFLFNFKILEFLF